MKYKLRNKKFKRRHFPAEQSRLERQIAKMYFRGAIQAEIATEFNITQQTVSNYLKVIMQKWSKANVEKIDEIKQEELAKIDHLEMEYWIAWKRSCEDAECESIKARPTAEGKGEIVEKRQSKEGQSGDPRFLEGIQWCIEQRCKIIGVEAPQKKDIMSGGKAFRLVPPQIIVSNGKTAAAIKETIERETKNAQKDNKDI